MAGALMDKVWGLFGMDSAEQEEYDEDIYDYDNEDEQIDEDKKQHLIKKIIK